MSNPCPSLNKYNDIHRKTNIYVSTSSISFLMILKQIVRRHIRLSEALVTEECPFIYHKMIGEAGSFHDDEMVSDTAVYRPQSQLLR
jgi:hypothetical protein